MSRSPEQKYQKTGTPGTHFIWNKEFEYSANTEKLHRWLKLHGYKRSALTEIVGIGWDKAKFVYAKGNFTLYEAKKLAVGVGMSLYDFIDIFLSDIYPVTPGDFDILSDDEEL